MISSIRTLALLSSVSVLLAGSSGPCQARPPKDGLVPFESKAGGYEIRIPPSWQASETSEEGRYEATFSAPEGEERVPDLPTELRILRVADHGTVLETKSKGPREIATEYARKNSALSRKSGNITMIGPLRSFHGAETHSFRISSVAIDGPCIVTWMVVAVRGPQLFSASWDLPCTEDKVLGTADRPATMDEATARTLASTLLTPADAPAEKSTETMRDSLLIKRKWDPGRE
jgi:hypothetical protein